MTPRLSPGSDAELTWLLHRAAQRMHAAVGVAAEAHGLTLRDHIVLSALDKTDGLTQIELGTALGMDKTTLASELDKLERAGLIERRVDPRDRRARIPVATADGDAVRRRIARRATSAESEAVRSVAPEHLELVRGVLYAIIGDNDDPGTCV